MRSLLQIVVAHHNLFLFFAGGTSCDLKFNVLINILMRHKPVHLHGVQVLLIQVEIEIAVIILRNYSLVGSHHFEFNDRSILVLAQNCFLAYFQLVFTLICIFRPLANRSG
jgi:hypothetical protein